MLAELAGWPLWQRGVEDIVLDRLAVLGLIHVRLFLCFDIDRGAVIGGADRAGKEGTVVARVVPRKAAEVISKYAISDMYAKAVQGMRPEDAVKWAHAELVKIYA